MRERCKMQVRADVVNQNRNENGGNAHQICRGRKTEVLSQLYRYNCDIVDIGLYC